MTLCYCRCSGLLMFSSCCWLLVPYYLHDSNFATSPWSNRFQRRTDRWHGAQARRRCQVSPRRSKVSPNNGEWFVLWLYNLYIPNHDIAVGPGPGCQFQSWKVKKMCTCERRSKCTHFFPYAARASMFTRCFVRATQISWFGRICKRFQKKVFLSTKTYIGIGFRWMTLFMILWVSRSLK